MRRILSLLFAAVFLVGCGNANFSESEKITVYTSIYPMYDFAAKIGGGKAEVFCMIEGGADPHDWEPTPALISRLERADVFIYSGAGMEPWAQKVLSALNNKDLLVLEASRGVSFIDESENPAHGHDPHVWLDPKNAKIELRNIRDILSEAAPEHKGYFEANCIKYAEELDRLDGEFRAALSSLPKKDIIVSHKAFGYLCAAYGLNQVSPEGLSHDADPSPAKMAEIIAFAREHNIKVIFYETLSSPKLAEAIAKAAGVKTDVLNPLEGLSDEEKAAGEDYFSVMRKNLKALENALK